MPHWTTIKGNLSQGDPLQIFLAEENGRICYAGMNSRDHPLSQDEFLWRLGSSRKWEKWSSRSGSGVLDAAILQMEEYFAGLQLDFDLPLEFQGTPFQISVWKAMQRIPYGQTRSYGDVAETVDRPAAMRAVGQAAGKCSFGIIVPCHRVIAAGGKIGGFGGSVGLKNSLLEHEKLVMERRHAA